MFAKVAILVAVFAVANATALLGAALTHTGSSITSRHQDAHGNYAFKYSVNDGHASSKSQSEVGTGGHKASAYNSHINHVAPAVAVAHAAPIVHAAPAVAVAHAAPIAHAAPLAYSTSSVVNHVAAAPALHHVAAAPLVHATPLSVAAPVAPLAHAAPLALAAPVSHAAPVAYSTSSVVDHVAAAPVAPVIANHGYIGAGHLAYAKGVAGHGLLSHRLGGLAHGIHY